MKSILICTHHRANPNQPSCGVRGAQALKQAFTDAVANEGLGLKIVEIQCLGECEAGPNMRLIPSGPIFHHVDLEQVPTIIDTAKQFLKDGS